MIQKCEKLKIGKINQWTQGEKRYFHLDNLASAIQHQKRETCKWGRHRQLNLRQAWSTCQVFIQLGLHCQKILKSHETRERKTLYWMLMSILPDNSAYQISKHNTKDGTSRKKLMASYSWVFHVSNLFELVLWAKAILNISQ